LRVFEKAIIACSKSFAWVAEFLVLMHRGNRDRVQARPVHGRKKGSTERCAL